MTEKRHFTYFDESGNAVLRMDDIYDYMEEYIPESYRVNRAMTFLRGVGRNMEFVRQVGGDGTVNDEKNIQTFGNYINDDAFEDGTILCPEARNRYLVIAREYLGAVSGLVLDDTDLVRAA